MYCSCARDSEMANGKTRVSACSVPINYHCASRPLKLTYYIHTCAKHKRTCAPVSFLRVYPLHTELFPHKHNATQYNTGPQEKKGERIQEKRGEQKEFMKSVVQRVLGEFITAGRLGKTELDEAAQGVLEKMEAKVRTESRKESFEKIQTVLCLYLQPSWCHRHAHPTL